MIKTKDIVNINKNIRYATSKIKGVVVSNLFNKYSSSRITVDKDSGEVTIKFNLTQGALLNMINHKYAYEHNSLLKEIQEVKEREYNFGDRPHIPF